MDHIDIPEAKTLPGIGDAYRLAFQDPLNYFQDLQEKHGEIIRFKLGPVEAILVTSPDLVAQVAGRDVRTYKKGKNFTSTRLFLGEGIFVAEGQKWRVHRRMMNPKFTEKEAKLYADIVTKTTSDTVDRWLKNGNEPFAMDYDMGHLAMTVIIKSLFGPGIDKEEKYGNAVRTCLDFVMERGSNPFPLPMALPIKSHQKFKDAKQLLEDFIYESIEKAKKNPHGRTLINDLLAAEDEESKVRLSEEEIKDQVLTIFLAGHETTALALSWGWYLLDQHPEIERKIRQEIAEVLGDREPVADDIAKLKYTRKVAMEILRLYPPVGVYPRQSLIKQKLGPYVIEKDEHIMLAPYLTHRIAEYWPKPNVFDPERFDDAVYSKQHPFAYFPFGKGRRICMGQHFAMMELVLVIATTLQKVRLEVVTKKVTPKFVATIRPSELKMKVEPLS